MSTDTLEIRPRYCECDPMGVVHHSVYPVWFEMGRTELLRSTGISYRELEESGVLLAVVRLEVRYKRPARYDEELQLETRIASVGRVKIEHEYRLTRGDELLATATTTLACLDREGAARPLPDRLLDRSPGS
ncbi:MAG: thioesterase family protein [Planctomycetota bacterium]|nr:thioesterase family protein [Planctomycetota bacterium]MEC8558804.1 thioesterase family protein [Planctomycetota bacterium]MEC8734656.1 thioesterase family protein [Planctomycetota bacterium]MEC8818163.1 thioesterase family protein [Planctomycetota bacterium]MEC9157015.1 thioesterase family protein [Planctomycetota bacterium]